MRAARLSPVLLVLSGVVPAAAQVRAQPVRAERVGQAVDHLAMADGTAVSGLSPVGLQPVILLRRSEKRLPPGGHGDVLVQANPAKDEIARRVAALMAEPDGFSQLVLRLDRSVKSYLLADQRLETSRRAVLAEPAYLFLSDRQGGFPAEHFWLEKPDGSLQEKRDVAFVDTVVEARDLEPGSPDGVEAIYAHELGHLMMAALAGPAPQRATSEVHFVTVRTDAWTAFVEGFGEHFQPMSLDHDADAPWQRERDRPLAAPVAKQYERFATEQAAGCWICPANLAFLHWHGRGESWLRDGPLRENQFVRPVSLPAELAGERRPAFEARMYRDVVPRFADGLKNGAQMLESEGVVATFFHAFASDARLRGRYREPAFYRPFLPPTLAGPLQERGPEALVSPAENVYLKMFEVLHTSFAWGDWPTIAFVEGYARRFPDEAEAAYDVFLQVTRGVTVERAAALHHAEPGYLAGLRARLLAREARLDGNLGRPLWIAVPGFRLGMGLFRYFPLPTPLTLDLNAADGIDLREIDGIDAALAAAIVEARERRGWFESVDDLAAVRGVTPALLARLREMRTRMQERLSRQRPRTSDPGWMENLLVTALRASYWLAAAWQYGRATVVAGGVWALVWLVVGRLLRPQQVTTSGTGLRARAQRLLRRVSLGCLVAAAPCAASVLLDALGVRPSPMSMLAVGLTIALVWQIARAAVGHGSHRLPDHMQVIAAVTAAAITIGAMY